MFIKKHQWLLLGSIFLLSACSDNKPALKTWTHADTGSYSAAISPDGKYLMTGAIEGFGRVWDLPANKVLFSLQHQDSDGGGMTAAAFSQRSEVLVTMEQQSLARWRVSSGKLIGYWSWPDLTDIDISADGRYALIASKANQAVYFDMRDGKMVYVFPHHEKVTTVSLSKDGRYALTGSDDWHASLWDLKDGKHLWSKNMKYKISLVELSDDGEFALANAFIGDAHIYRTSGKGELLSRLDDIRMTLVSADFSDNGRTLATGRAAKSIDIWDVATGNKKESWRPKVKHLVQPDSATILDLKLDANATTLISESSTGIGQSWALKL
ncbi:MAG: WD40 repeat protein [Gammaproteobacteria bacterium]|jgi:WD40 repeat protein